MTMSAWRVKAGLSLLTCFYGVCDLPFPCASPQETSYTSAAPFFESGGNTAIAHCCDVGHNQLAISSP